MIRLIVLAGPDAGSVFMPEKDPFVIGHTNSCDVVLHDIAVSGRHCVIRHEENNFVLTDLKSRNGTFLNEPNSRVETSALNNGDEILLGKSRIRVEFVDRTEKEQNTARPESFIQPPPLVTPPAQLPVVDPGEFEDANEITLSGKLFPQAEENVGQTVMHELSQSRIVLRIIEGKDAGRAFQPQPGMKRFTVGRGKDVDFRLQDQGVSRVHFVVELTSKGFVLTDEGSLNGTFLNDLPHRVQIVILQKEDKIRVCDTLLKVELLSPEEWTVYTASAQSPKATLSSQPPAFLDQTVLAAQAQDELSGRIRTARVSRFWATTLVMLIATGVPLGFSLANKLTFFASAPLTIGHERWEDACTTCHTPWKSQAMATACSVSSCHANVLTLNMPMSEKGRKGHNRCGDCHTEHRGRNFDIKGGAQQCWACHETTYNERRLWSYYKKIAVPTGKGENSPLHLRAPLSDQERRVWQQSIPHVESGLRFAHARHERDSGIVTCESCHQPLPGEIINALGVVSAFPTHEECLKCHKDVGMSDPPLAGVKVAKRCMLCHTREDGKVTHVQREIAYVRFSHDFHKTAACKQCHFTLDSEQAYGPALLSAAVYPLPMNACVGCHEQKNATTACLDCHPAHHSPPTERLENSGFLSRINLSNLLLFLLTLQVGAVLCLYVLKRVEHQ